MGSGFQTLMAQFAQGAGAGANTDFEQANAARNEQSALGGLQDQQQSQSQALAQLIEALKGQLGGGENGLIR